MKQGFAVVTIILLAGVAASYLFADRTYEDQLEMKSPAELSESQRLEIAKQHWDFASGSSFDSGTLKSLTGKLNLAHGSYDPTFEPAPDLPVDFIDGDDYTTTGMVFVQSVNYDYDWLFDLQATGEVFILDNLGDGNFIVRLNSASEKSFEKLLAIDQSRWVGNIDPGFRVNPLLLSPNEFTKLALIPSEDLLIGGLEDLAVSLLRYGAVDSWCGVTICQVVVKNSYEFVVQAARDGRLIWIEPISDMIIHNSVARALSGVTNMETSASFTLDGSGEMLAIVDTGLDRDHPDINGRVAAVYTQFGLDTSPADSNGGHGTHVTLTAIGDGTGDSTVEGIAPSASVIMYALEYDPTGAFGRQGSIYDMLADAKQKTARTAINAWGLDGNFGAYTADSRSVDQFVYDASDLLPIFSVGDWAGQGSNQVSPISTAKNILSVGVSTTGSGGTAPQGAVDSISREGPTIDGRIKPDVVAPGIEICSGRANEARNPAGFACASGSHDDGDPLYMSLSGTSQSASVAGGLAALTRQYLREQVGIQSPSASLIKATMINGAVDLGASDRPNNIEGWGQLNLENSLIPMDGDTVLSTYFDDKKVLRPSFGLVYEFTLNPNHGFEVTLAWNDQAGSANSDQSNAKLINDLDLLVTAPNGDKWFGNSFNAGFSIRGGEADSINNVERVSLPKGAYTNSGKWLVQVIHQGGSSQDFSIVISGDATPVTKPDLLAFSESIELGTPNPLKDDIVSIRVSWMNQGTGDANSFHWMLEDVTENVILMQGDSPGLASSEIESEITTRSFTTTGTHKLRLSLDTDNDLDEINDELAGINNNVIELDVEVSALGVRVYPMNEDGSLPVTEPEKQSAAINYFDVKNDTDISIPITIKNEGTNSEAITLFATNIQEKHPLYNYFISPKDTWTKTISQTGPYTLQPQGDLEDSIELSLNFNNENSILDDADSPRYARAGTFYVDLTVAYQSNPSVSHSIRMTIIIPEIDDAKISVSGTSGLSANPGSSASFSISVMNVGNSPAQYSVECKSENLWQIMLGNSNSSSLDFEPLDISEYLPMKVEIFVPDLSSGFPNAGFQDSVVCFVTSLNDASLNYSQSILITVEEVSAYSVNLKKDGNDIVTGTNIPDIFVDSGEHLILEYLISNLGNSDLTLDVIAQQSNPIWYVDLSIDSVTYPKQATLTIPAGQSTVVKINIVSPSSAVSGDFITLDLTAEVSTFDYLKNETRIVINDELSVELQSPQKVICYVRDSFSYTEFNITNTGNAIVRLNWSYYYPSEEGWVVGFANPVKTLEPRAWSIVNLGVIPPLNTPIQDSAFQITISVIADNNGRIFEQSTTLDVAVIESKYGNLTLGEDNQKPFIGIPKGDTASSQVLLRNDGNTVLSGDLSSVVVDLEGKKLTNWKVNLEPPRLTGVNPGETVIIDVEVKCPNEANKGPYQIFVNLSDGEQIVASINLQASASNAKEDTGLFNSLPWYVSVISVIIGLVGVLLLLSRIRRQGIVDNYATEQILADVYGTGYEAGDRRESALNIGQSQDEKTSGEVSQAEIAAALAQSMSSEFTSLPMPNSEYNLPSINPHQPILPPPAILPSLPPPNLPPPPSQNQFNNTMPESTTPPIPSSGLPIGWTIEQWNAYGNMWLEKNSK